MRAKPPARLPIDPSTIAGECLCLGLKRAARAVARRYDEAFRPLALNHGQFSMLSSVAGLEPLRVQALGEHLAMDRTTVTAALKPLQRRGLIDVVVSPADPRGRDVTLTRAGRILLARAMPVWRSLQDELARSLSAPEAAQLHQRLSQLR